MTYDRDQIRKWLLLGGSKCPLTGVQLVTRKVGRHWLGALLQPRRAMQSFHNNAPISAGHALKGVVIILGSMPQDDGLRHSKAMPPHRHASSILTRTHAASR